MFITNTPQLADKYGKRAPQEYLLDTKPILSFPISIEDIPQQAAYFALELIDYDTLPLTGFAWIHWLAANIPITSLIPEDMSRQDHLIVQGRNSLCSLYGQQMLPQLKEKEIPELTQRYLGPSPRNGQHTYTLYLYALKKPLSLQPGFYANELHQKMNGQILAKTKFEFLY